MSDTADEITCGVCGYRLARLLDTEFPNKSHLVGSVHVRHFTDPSGPKAEMPQHDLHVEFRI